MDNWKFTIVRLTIFNCVMPRKTLSKNEYLTWALQKNFKLLNKADYVFVIE